MTARAKRAPRAAKPEVSAPITLAGNLDVVRADGTIEGWCWSADEPDRHRKIAVLINGDVVATGLCNRPRPDLIQAGVGNGAHAFNLTIPAQARVAHATVMVTMREIATDEAIGGPVTITWAEEVEAPVQTAVPPPADPVAHRKPHGNVDGVTKDGRISGWCWYPEAPEETIRLTVLVDDEIVGTAVAGNFRPDLHQAGIGTGAYGFSFALPWTVLSSKGLLTIALRDELTALPLGQDLTLRLGRMAGAEDRVAELERQIRALRGQIDELKLTLQASSDERPNQDLFQAIGAMFQELARGGGIEQLGQVPGQRRPALREAIASLQQRHTPFTLDIPDRPLATIALPAQAGMPALHRCLQALRTAGVDRHADIVLVDDGSRSPSGSDTALLPSVVRNLRYLRLDEGADIATCLNELARSAHTDMLVYMAPGLSPEPGWLEALAETLAREPEIALIGSRVVGRDGLLRHAGLLVQDGDLPTPLGLLADAMLPEFSFMRPVDGMGALAYAVRRSALLEAGGFQPGFESHGHATLDLCLRLRAAGHGVFYQPGSTVLCDDSFDVASLVPDLAAQDEDTLRLRQRWFDTTHALTPVRFAGHALVIDNEIPRPDRDAGSISAMEQMLLLRKLGYRVTFAAAGSSNALTAGGGNAPDIEARFLEGHGIEVARPPSYRSVSDYLARNGLDLDLVQVYRYMNAAMFIERVRTLAPSAKLIFSPADLHHLRELRHATVRGALTSDSAGKHKVAGPLAISADAIRDQELACVRQADVTILNSDFELGLLQSEIGSDSISNSGPARLRLLRWVSHPHPSKHGFAERAGIAFVGGFRHGPNADGVIWFVANVMPLLRSRGLGLVLHIAGSDMPEEVRALAAADIIVHGWVEDLAALLDRVRLTVAPLRYGAGFKGKVATSLAHGVPVVGSSIAFEGTGLADGDGIALADNAAEFADALERLHTDPAAWGIAAEQALDRCRALYSPEAALDVYRGMLEDFGLPVG